MSDSEDRDSETSSAAENESCTTEDAEVDDQETDEDSISEEQRESDDDAFQSMMEKIEWQPNDCLLYTSPSPRDLSTSRMPSSA